mmetsp:Transcript_15353/g.50423  ORF Transcript_15353/g.50423 Transcript_15353/m.50423 type:complete len:265 (-) Transcript_15353:28-822(-)
MGRYLLYIWRPRIWVAASVGAARARRRSARCGRGGWRRRRRCGSGGGVTAARRDARAVCELASVLRRRRCADGAKLCGGGAQLVAPHLLQHSIRAQRRRLRHAHSPPVRVPGNHDERGGLARGRSDKLGAGPAECAARGAVRRRLRPRLPPPLARACPAGRAPGDGHHLRHLRPQRVLHRGGAQLAPGHRVAADGRPALRRHKHLVRARRLLRRLHRRLHARDGCGQRCRVDQRLSPRRIRPRPRRRRLRQHPKAHAEGFSVME